MGYRLNRLDEPVFMAGPKPMLTEVGIHHGLESCEGLYVPVIGVSVGAPVGLFPIRVFLWHVNTKPLHLFDKVIFVVAQRTLEKVAGGVGKTLDTRFVKPGTNQRLLSVIRFTTSSSDIS